MSASRKPSFLSLPAEIRHEIVLHYILLSASEFQAPNGILATPLDRPLLVFCDSKAEIGTIPLILGEEPETTTRLIGRWPSLHVPQTAMNLMLVNKLRYSDVSSMLLSEFALIPPRQLFRFVHWIPFVPNQNTQMFDLVRHLQLRISFSLHEKGAAEHYHNYLNSEDVSRFREFRDWFGGLRSVRFQIEFRGGTSEMPSSKKNVVKRIMKCADVFQAVEVLLFVEPPEEIEGETLYEDLENVKEETIKEIIEECRAQLQKQHP